MGSKTPVTVLQELCGRRKAGVPMYELVEDGSGEMKLFMYKLTSFDQTIFGSGRSKKDAKHEAANKMLQLLQRHLNDMDQFAMPSTHSSIDGNAVGELLDICVQRNIPIPEFKLLNASGPSHAPEFTYECCVATINRYATHSTKKGAKQMVAQKMVSVLQNMVQDDDKMQIGLLSATLDEENVKNISTIRTYLELKNSDSKYVPGVKLYNRHNYFKEFDSEKRDVARSIINNCESPTVKVPAIFKALDLTYEISEIGSTVHGKQSLFELKGDYDCMLVAPVPQIHKTVLSFMKLMIE